MSNGETRFVEGMPSEAEIVEVDEFMRDL